MASSMSSSGARPVVAESSLRRDSVSGLRCTTIGISVRMTRITVKTIVSPTIDPSRHPSIGSRYYYRARYYDPAAGRLLREDPFGFQAGPNFYAYTLNQPSNFIDPLGLDIAVVENGPTPPSNGDLLGNPVG